MIPKMGRLGPVIGEKVRKPMLFEIEVAFAQLVPGKELQANRKRTKREPKGKDSCHHEPHRTRLGTNESRRPGGFPFWEIIPHSIAYSVEQCR